MVNFTTRSRPGLLSGAARYVKKVLFNVSTWLFVTPEILTLRMINLWALRYYRYITAQRYCGMAWAGSCPTSHSANVGRRRASAAVFPASHSLLQAHSLPGQKSGEAVKRAYSYREARPPLPLPSSIMPKVSIKNVFTLREYFSATSLIASSTMSAIT